MWWRVFKNQENGEMDYLFNSNPREVTFVFYLPELNKEGFIGSEYQRKGYSY